MAYAATTGRKITFHWLAAKRTVEGYLVGMDDFNWLTISSGAETLTISSGVETLTISSGAVTSTILVHKTSPDFAVISTESSLGSEPRPLQDAVEEIGRGFFTYCERTFMGKR